MSAQMNPQDFNAMWGANAVEPTYQKALKVEREFLEARKFSRETMQRHGLQVHLADSHDQHPTAIPFKNRKFISEGFDYIAIPYWQLDGSPLEHNLNGVVTRYCRWRKHKHVSSKFTDKDGNEHETKKYTVLKGTVPNAYFCKPVDWVSVAKDVSVPIVIVEGELSAITCNEAAIAAGLPHRFIATGGIWMLFYKGARRNKADLIAPFNDDTCTFRFDGREVFLCYDLDKGGFDAQIQALAVQLPVLEKRGAAVTVLDLSMSKYYVDATKHAPDDFFNMGGTVQELVSLVADQSKIQLSPMRLTQDRLGVLATSGDLFDLEYGLPRKTAQFKGIAGHYGYGDEAKALDLFLVSPRTYSIASVNMNDKQEFGPHLVTPGRQNIRASYSFNAWKGLALAPGPSLKRADDEWERLLKLIYGDGWQWAEGYFAFMVQHPLERQAQSIIIIDPMRGYGKSSHTGPIHRILGRYAKVIEDRNFARQFSDAYYNTVLVQINDASIASHMIYRLWQTRVSEPTLDIEMKGIQTMTGVPNYSRTIMSTNVPKDMSALKPDRRSQVVMPKIRQSDLPDLRDALHIKHPEDKGLNVYEALLHSDDWARSILARLLDINWAEHYQPGKAAPNYAVAEELAESIAEPVEILEAAVRDSCEGILVLSPQLRMQHAALCSMLLARTPITKCFARVRLVSGESVTQLTILSFNIALPTIKKAYGDRTEIQYDGDSEQVRKWYQRTVGAITTLSSSTEPIRMGRNLP